MREQLSFIPSDGQQQLLQPTAEPSREGGMKGGVIHWLERQKPGTQIKSTHQSVVFDFISSAKVRKEELALAQHILDPMHPGGE